MGEEIFSYPPVADENCRALILGTMPSVASLEAGNFYAHPRNAFWKIMDALLDGVPDDFPGRYAALLQNHIALYDVLKSCEREGSLDARIKNEIPNDVRALIDRCPKLRMIYLNGGTAARFYKKYFKDLPLPYTILPSTSPAAAMYSFEEKLAAWAVIKERIREERA